MLAADLEHLSRETFRCPVRHRDQAVLLAYTLEFTCNDLGPWREHCTKHRDHRIETALLVRKVLSVANLKPCVEALARRIFPGLLNEVGRDVDAGHIRTRPGRRQSGIAGAA